MFLLFLHRFEYHNILFYNEYNFNFFAGTYFSVAL
jgi:hypothetical protein